MSTLVEALRPYIDLSQKSLAISAAAIVFNPVFWNIAARQEHRTRFLSRLFGGNAQNACYFLAAVIFSLGLIRDALYSRALQHQPTWTTPPPQLTTMVAAAPAYALLAAGNTLVLSSMWALGVTGTYLGDYFGILMPARVTRFPFNLVDAPMYVGSTMSFVGVALLKRSWAGLALSALVAMAYWVACTWEDPFTAEIYAKRDRERAVAGKKAS